MSNARFIFQALYPDAEPHQDTVLVVFDAEYEGGLLSHRIARLRLTEKGIDVWHEAFPFSCPGFVEAAKAYHQFMMETHGQILSPSGPKGLRKRDNVFRAEWVVHLPATLPTPATDH